MIFALTVASLLAAYSHAIAAWQLAPTPAPVIETYNGRCRPGDLVAYSDLATNVIRLNRGCDWDRRYLSVIMSHEVGHLLSGQWHSLNRHSVMFSAPVRTLFWQFLDIPHVTREDRKSALDLLAGRGVSASEGDSAGHYGARVDLR